MSKDQRQQVEEYAGKASMHALPIAILSTTLLQKLFWTLVWICGTIGAGIHIYLQYKFYKSYPYDVNIIYIHSNSLTFPAVTFCNMSPLRKSGLFCQSKDLENLISLELFGNGLVCNKLGPNAYFPLHKFWDCINNTHYEFLHVPFCRGGEIEVNQEWDSPSFDYADWYSDPSTFYTSLLGKAKSDDLTDIQRLIRFSDDNLVDHGYFLQDMLVSCSFNGVNCTENLFSTSVHSQYGLCHTFNKAPANKSLEAIKTKRRGFSNGLKLVLNIQSEEYVGLVASEYGIRVAIHPPEQEAPLGTESINVGVGKKTSIGVTLVEIKRLKHPFKSNCTESYPELFKYYTYDEVYTEVGCRQSCTSYYLDLYCNCVDEIGEYVDEDNILHIDDEGPDLCSVTDKNQTKCIMNINARLTKNPSDPDALSCDDCRTACHETTYSKTVSTTVWPTKGFQNIMSYNPQDLKKGNGLSKFLINMVKYQNDYTKRYNEFYGIPSKQPDMEEIAAKNLVHLHVYYEQLNFEIIEEKASYKITSFLADIGGILGLYIGMSIISFIEIFEALYLALHYMICGQNRQGKKKVHSSKNKNKPADVSVALPSQVF